MLLNNLVFINILSCKIYLVNYEDILFVINEAIKKNNSLVVTGANAHVLNLCYENEFFRSQLKKITLIHPDGLGTFLSIRFLYPKFKNLLRITGSDFYEYLISFCERDKIPLFFFGDEEKTLNLIHLKRPHLSITGMHNGFIYEDDQVIKKINESLATILIVGLGSGRQESWISDNKSKIRAKVIIAVGDGIKVFAGNKKRGPKIIQKLGFEWFIRFIFEPKRLWKRYFIGIPLFIFRVIKFKFTNTKTG